jgi:hypothetical protein
VRGDAGPSRASMLGGRIARTRTVTLKPREAGTIMNGCLLIRLCGKEAEA